MTPSWTHRPTARLGARRTAHSELYAAGVGHFDDEADYREQLASFRLHQLRVAYRSLALRRPDQILEYEILIEGKARAPHVVLPARDIAGDPRLIMDLTPYAARKLARMVVQAADLGDDIPSVHPR